MGFNSEICLRLQLLLGNVELGLQILFQKVSEGTDEYELVFPQLDQAPEHVNEVVIVHL